MFFDNRNRKKITLSRKKAKILTVNRKSYHLIETLLTKTWNRKGRLDAQ